MLRITLVSCLAELQYGQSAAASDYYQYRASWVAYTVGVQSDIMSAIEFLKTETTYVLEARRDGTSFACKDSSTICTTSGEALGDLTMAKQLLRLVVVRTEGVVLISQSVRAATRALSDKACPAPPASRIDAGSGWSWRLDVCANLEADEIEIRELYTLSID